MFTSYIPGTSKTTVITYAFNIFIKPVDSSVARELDLRSKLQMAEAEHGVTNLIEQFEDRDFVYLVTSKMNGGTLQNFMEERRQTKSSYLIAEEWQKHARQIVHAVAAIHAAGYLHNEIHPENILLKHNKN